MRTGCDAGVCYQDILLPNLWLLITHLGPQCGLRMFLDVLAVKSASFMSHPLFSLLRLACDTSLHIIASVSTAVLCSVCFCCVRFMWTLVVVVPRMGPGQPPPLIPSLPHLLLYLLVSFIFLFFISYFFNLFSCFSTPSHSTRIVPLCFQAGCRRRRLNLALVIIIITHIFTQRHYAEASEALG